MTKRILYVCVHNAGRSQMAEALTNHIARERGLDVIAESAGTASGKAINPQAIEVMNEIGISMQGQTPKIISQELVDRATKVISMGCGVDLDACPAKFLLADDWNLEDPFGQSIDKVREIRDQIQSLVLKLLDSQSDTAHVESEIIRALENFIEAFNNLEWDRFRACFAPDATMYHPQIGEVSKLRLVRGQEGEQVFEGVFSASRQENTGPPFLNIRPTEINVQQFGDIAVVAFIFPRSDGFGRRTVVMQSVEGEWLIVHLHASNVINR